MIIKLWSSANKKFFTRPRFNIPDYFLVDRNCYIASIIYQDYVIFLTFHCDSSCLLHLLLRELLNFKSFPHIYFSSCNILQTNVLHVFSVWNIWGKNFVYPPSIYTISRSWLAKIQPFATVCKATFWPTSYRSWSLFISNIYCMVCRFSLIFIVWARKNNK